MQLFLMNVPYNCSDRELQEWIESRGFNTESIRVIRDLVSGASPAFAYVDVRTTMRVEEVVALLHGRKLRNQTISCKPASAKPKPRAATASR